MVGFLVLYRGCVNGRAEYTERPLYFVVAKSYKPQPHTVLLEAVFLWLNQKGYGVVLTEWNIKVSELAVIRQVSAIQ